MFLQSLHPPLSLISSSSSLYSHIMGNCLIRNNQISAQDDDDYDSYDKEQRREPVVVVEQKKTSGSSVGSEESMEKTKKKKKVRFELQGDGEERREESCRRSGSVRIRLVMTQEELKKILSQEKDAQQATLEQLLSSVKLRGSRRICEVIGEEDGGGMNAWRPSLESIAEDE